VLTRPVDLELPDRNDAPDAQSDDAREMVSRTPDLPTTRGYLLGGMAYCKNGRCERPFWATARRVYCEQCLVLGDDRRDRARLRYRRRVELAGRGDREPAWQS